MSTSDTQTFTVGILGAGQPPAEMGDQYPKYSTLIGDQLMAINPRIKAVSYNIWDGEMPESVHECDAWVISGSKFGVYEDIEWIEPLSNIIRAAYQNNLPLVGICFGHQLIAQALGGKVVKSEKGWSLGNETYRLINPPAWMHDAGAAFTIQAYHQDQVVELPPSATVLAESDFCPYAGLLFENGKTLTVQAHPEFGKAYMRALLDYRERSLPNDPITQAAYERVDDVNDRQQFIRWIAQFLDQAV